MDDETIIMDSVDELASSIAKALLIDAHLAIVCGRARVMPNGIPLWPEFVDPVMSQMRAGHAVSGDARPLHIDLVAVEGELFVLARIEAQP